MVNRAPNRSMIQPSGIEPRNAPSCSDTPIITAVLTLAPTEFIAVGSQFTSM